MIHAENMLVVDENIYDITLILITIECKISFPTSTEYAFKLWFKKIKSNNLIFWFCIQLQVDNVWKVEIDVADRLTGF